MIDNFVSGEIGIVDTKGHIEFGAFIAILGSESCSANSIEQISVSPLSLFIEVINKGNRPNIVVRGIVYGSTLVCTMLITIGITKNALGVRIICVESGFDAIQEQVTAAEQEIAALEKQRKTLQGNVKLLKAVEKVKPDLDAIQPEKTLTGAVKGVTVEQIKELKEAVIRGAAAEQKVRELKAKNQQLQKSIPSIEKTMEEARKQQRLENENRQLKVQVEYLEKDLSWERGISARLQEGIGAVLDFLDRHLPEQFRPLVEKARELLPVPEVQQPEREQERGHTWGGMEL